MGNTTHEPLFLSAKREAVAPFPPPPTPLPYTFPTHHHPLFPPINLTLSCSSHLPSLSLLIANGGVMMMGHGNGVGANEVSCVCDVCMGCCCCCCRWLRLRGLLVVGDVGVSYGSGGLWVVVDDVAWYGSRGLLLPTKLAPILSCWDGHGEGDELVMARLW